MADRKAQTPAEVVAGEARAKSFEDKLAIASVMHNRKDALQTSLEDVVQSQSEFNAYNKALPPGIGDEDVQEAALALDMTREKYNRVTNATFYATPAAQSNLPNGLKQVHSTDGHNFFSDPQNRSIRTSSGFRQVSPLAMQELEVPTRQPSFNPSATQGFQTPASGYVGSEEEGFSTQAGQVFDKDEYEKEYSKSNLPTPEQSPRMTAYAGGFQNLDPRSYGINRPDPINKDLASRVSAAAAAASAALGDDFSARINSGTGEYGVRGSQHRHSVTGSPYGMAGDFSFFNETQNRPATRKEMNAIMQASVAAGIDMGGVGYGKGYMGESVAHLDLGNPRSWGGQAPSLARGAGYITGASGKRVAPSAYMPGMSQLQAQTPAAFSPSSQLTREQAAAISGRRSAITGEDTVMSMPVVQAASQPAQTNTGALGDLGNFVSSMATVGPTGGPTTRPNNQPSTPIGQLSELDADYAAAKARTDARFAGYNNANRINNANFNPQGPAYNMTAADVAASQMGPQLAYGPSTRAKRSSSTALANLGRPTSPTETGLVASNDYGNQKTAPATTAVAGPVTRSYSSSGQTPSTGYQASAMQKGLEQSPTRTGMTNNDIASYNSGSTMPGTPGVGGSFRDAYSAPAAQAATEARQQSASSPVTGGATLSSRLDTKGMTPAASISQAFAEISNPATPTAAPRETNTGVAMGASVTTTQPQASAPSSYGGYAKVGTELSDTQVASIAQAPGQNAGMVVDRDATGKNTVVQQVQQEPGINAEPKYGFSGLAISSNTQNRGTPQQTNQNEHGYGGNPAGGTNSQGGGKFLCTAYYRFGDIDREVIALDMAHGKKMSAKYPAVRKGYEFWGAPLAVWLQREGVAQKIVRATLRPWICGWAREMAHQERPDKYGPNYFGKVWYAAVVPLCWLIGKARHG